jgi:hypothetical protein
MLQVIRHDDWIVLEAQPSIAPQLGAGFMCAANGSRILDQLGVLGQVRATTEHPLEKPSS